MKLTRRLFFRKTEWALNGIFRTIGIEENQNFWRMNIFVGKIKFKSIRSKEKSKRIITNTEKIL